MNGVSLLLPEAAASIVFAPLGLLRVFVFCKAHPACIPGNLPGKRAVNVRDGARLPCG